MGASTTRALRSWTGQLPRSKLSVAVEKPGLASSEELEGMGRFDLIVQRKKREKLLSQMVGTLYTGIVMDEQARIQELLLRCSHRWRTEDE